MSHVLRLTGCPWTYNIADSLSGYHKVEILMANNTMTEVGVEDVGLLMLPADAGGGMAVDVVGTYSRLFRFA